MRGRRMPGGAAFLIVAAGLCRQPCFGQESELDRLMKLGAEALLAGRTATSLQHFQAAQARYDSDPGPPVGIAVACLRLGNLASARYALQDAASDAEPALSLGLATCALAEGRLSTARELYEAALARHVTREADWRAAVAYTNLILGNRLAAQAEAQQALRQDGELILGLMVLGECALQEGAADAAAQFVRRALALAASPDANRALRVVAPSQVEQGLSPLAGMGMRLGVGGPELRIVSPRPGEKVSGIVNVVGEMLGESPKIYVTFSVNGRLKWGSNRPPFQFQWDTRDLPAGRYRITIQGRETFAADRRLEDSVMVVVGQSEEGGTARGTVERSPTYRQALADLEKALLVSPSDEWLDSMRKLAYPGGSPTPPGNETPPTWQPLAPSGGGTRPVPANTLAQTPKRVCLIFDDGPNPIITPAILSILKETRTPAGFFLVGKQAEAYPDLVRRIVAEGHEIGNHTYSHCNLNAARLVSEIEEEILGNKALLESIAGVPVPYFRAPGGNCNARVRLVVTRNRLISMESCYNTWGLMDLDPPEIAQRTIESARDGSLILLHNGEDKSVFVLPLIIDGLRRRGFTLVSVSEWNRLRQT